MQHFELTILKPIGPMKQDEFVLRKTRREKNVHETDPSMIVQPTTHKSHILYRIQIKHAPEEGTKRKTARR